MIFAGQGRMDGAFCDFTENEKQDYFKQVNPQNIFACTFSTYL